MIIAIIILTVICLFFVFLSMSHYNAYIKEHKELVKLQSEYAELHNKYSEYIKYSHEIELYEEAYKKYKTAN